MITHPNRTLPDDDECPAFCRYSLGLDIGQIHDPSALAVVKKSWTVDRHGRAQDVYYHCGFLHRWPLGTKYSEVIEDTKSIYNNAQFIGQARINGRWRKFQPTLAVDCSGVGAPISEELVKSGNGINAYGIYIAGGETYNRAPGRRFNIPKKDLISGLVLNLQNSTLKISKGLKDAPAMLKELKSFKVKIKPSGHEVLEHAKQSDHDDLLISLSMALWILDYASVQLDEVQLFWK